MPLVARDTPLTEITLRRYEKPFEVSGRELYKKLCLSIGLLQPGDSRDVIVDVLQVLHHASSKKQLLACDEVQQLVIKNRDSLGLPQLGIAPSNIRRQIRRLKDLFIVESVINKYRITEFEQLSVLYHERIEQFLIANILERVREYFSKLN
ncbi:MAG: hypothetical protein AABW49_01540 [Nanoarchaeota archaeon]